MLTLPQITSDPVFYSRLTHSKKPVKLLYARVSPDVHSALYDKFALAIPSCTQSVIDAVKKALLAEGWKEGDFRMSELRPAIWKY